MLQKQAAVDQENYDEAQKLKAVITRLQNGQIQIENMEEKKQISVMQEDYETAKLFKDQIDLLLQELTSKQAN